ncbi:MAG: beta-ketoacyl-[acyl-carrier-protein] synthase family protein [Deltaproteobacteria bacterium]|nr:beta-ketoacyl-[acyl-carrier-protein] synthase family protein [Deltaproteobacteria bacterium]
MIVLSGVGAVSGYGLGFSALKHGLASGKRSFAPWALLDSVRCPQHPVCAVPDGIFQPDEPHSRSATLALLAAKEALAEVPEDARRQIGVIVGSTTGGMALTEATVLDAPHTGTAAFDARIAREHPVSETTNLVARKLGLFGPRTTVVSACSSGLNAVILARRWIELGLCQTVLAIGADALSRLTLVGFASLGAVDGEGARPFQKERKGITIGEGAAAFLVERKDDAHRAGRRARGVVAGSAIIGEAFHATQPDPSGAGAARAMRLALEDGKLDATAIDAVSAHGTATQQNDAMEAKAVAAVFGKNVPVSSQKSQLGHTLGAAGALELAACIAMLEDQHVYPTHGLSPDNVDPACAEIQHVMGAPLRRELRYLMKNSFAFGGQNSALVVGGPETAR